MTNRNRTRQREMRRRGNLWLPFSATLSLTASSSTQTDLLARYLLEHGAELPVGSTLGPIRGLISVENVTDTEVTSSIFGAIFLNAEGGLSSAPSLELEQVDAMWYQVMAMRSLLGDGPPSKEYVINTKAMRKITEIGQELTLQVDEILGETAAILTVGGHIFIKLP